VKIFLFVIIKVVIRNTRNQIGSAHVIIIIILVVAVLGLLGFVFWQNYIVQNVKTKDQPDLSQQKSKPESESAEDLKESYFVLDDWSVRFKISDGLTGIKYYKVSDSYELTTSRVEDLGGDCKEPAVDEVPGVIRLGSIGRKSNPVDSEYVLMLNDGEPINGYYYWYSAAQSTCAHDDPEGLQAIDRGLLSDTVNSIEAK
jgi:hypothetical protein